MKRQSLPRGFLDSPKTQILDRSVAPPIFRKRRGGNSSGLRKQRPFLELNTGWLWVCLFRPNTKFESLPLPRARAFRFVLFGSPFSFVVGEGGSHGARAHFAGAANSGHSWSFDLEKSRHTVNRQSAQKTALPSVHDV